MAETIIIIFAISILLILGVFTFYKYQLANIQDTGISINDQKITVLLATITQHPAIACNHENCIDTTKLLLFPAQDYKELLGSTTITLQQIYPTPTINKQCTPQLYNQITYPNNCNHWIIYNITQQGTEKNIISTPLALYYPETDTYRLGQLTIEANR